MSQYKSPIRYDEPTLWQQCRFYVIGVTITTLVILAFFVAMAHAEEIPNTQQIANAIYKAEGGAKTKHPYGILTHYKRTTPRQACINTINHAKRDWDGNGDFITFLGSRYCPPSAHPLNKNWVKNVKEFLKQEEK